MEVIALPLNVPQVGLEYMHVPYTVLVLLFFHSMSSGGAYPGTGTKSDLDNHADQCNPNNTKYQGHQPGYPGDGTKADRDNHADQLNPNNPKFQPKGGK